MPFLWEIDADVGFVGLPVGNRHNGNAVLKDDMQSTVTVEAFHTASNSLVLLSYGRALDSVI